MAVVVFLLTGHADLRIREDLEPLRRDRLAALLADAAISPVFFFVPREIYPQPDPSALATGQLAATAMEKLFDDGQVGVFFPPKHPDFMQQPQFFGRGDESMPVAIGTANFFQHAFSGENQALKATYRFSKRGKLE